MQIKGKDYDWDPTTKHVAGFVFSFMQRVVGEQILYMVYIINLVIFWESQPTKFKRIYCDQVQIN